MRIIAKPNQPKASPRKKLLGRKRNFGVFNPEGYSAEEHQTYEALKAGFPTITEDTLLATTFVENLTRTHKVDARLIGGSTKVARLTNPKSKNGITAHATEISSDKKIKNYDDAFATAQLIALNPAWQGRKIEISGTIRERNLIEAALKQVNKGLPKEMQVGVSNKLSWLRKIPGINMIPFIGVSPHYRNHKKGPSTAKRMSVKRKGTFPEVAQAEPEPTDPPPAPAEPPTPTEPPPAPAPAEPPAPTEPPPAPEPAEQTTEPPPAPEPTDPPTAAPADPPKPPEEKGPGFTRQALGKTAAVVAGGAGALFAASTGQMSRRAIENIKFLNEDAGTLLKETGIMSEELVDLQGKIQAVALAVAESYQDGNEEKRTALEDAGLIVDDRGDGKKFNDAKITRAADAISGSASLEAKAQAILARITQNATAHGITPDQIAAAEITVNSKKGNNRPGLPFVPPANRITAVISEDIAEIRDAILPLQAFLRSNLLEVASNRDLGLDREKFKFNIPIIGKDSVKEVIAAGKRISEAYEENTPPEWADLMKVRKGLDIALEDLRKIDEKIGDTANLSPLISRIEKLAKQTDGFNWQKISNRIPFTDKGTAIRHFDRDYYM